jgi:hypothetical protein
VTCRPSGQRKLLGAIAGIDSGKLTGNGVAFIVGDPVCAFGRGDIGSRSVMSAHIDVPVGSVPEGWRHARLIPTFGIRNQQEQEKRATSCLLAVIHGVPEFGHALLKELDAPKAPVIETFAEVRFKDLAGNTVIPDGAIVCRRGTKTWTCLVEVKTGSTRLKDEQVSTYLDIARANQLDGVLTVSTQITANSSESPCMVDRRKLRGGLGLWHFSWWRVLTEAVVQQRYRGISNPDQEWVLRELIHYLSSESSGAVGFEDMGDKWLIDRAVRQRRPVWKNS